ncbi:hypothetical protein Pelo_7312 [Pelomyxa schiedti]|nr:hypothetical protein Pelo_7312 [Pelomyxa schiedti]
MCISKIYLNVAHCESLLLTHASMMSAFQPRDSSAEYATMLSTSWGWTLPARDPLCGGKTALYVEDGLLFATFTSSIKIVVMQNCYPETTPSCLADVWIFDTSTDTLVGKMGTMHAVDEGFPTLFENLEQSGMLQELENSSITWGGMIATPKSSDSHSSFGNAAVSVSLFAALKRNASNPSQVTGIVRQPMLPEAMIATFESNVEGIYGVYIVEPNGLVIASTLENVSVAVLDSSNATVWYPLRANESKLEIVRLTYSSIPVDMNPRETSVRFLYGHYVAITRMVSEYNLEVYIITLGDKSYFDAEYSTSTRWSALAFALSCFMGSVAIGILTFALAIGLKSIQRSVKWLGDDQKDGTSLALRSDDGNYDSGMLEKVRKKSYSLDVWFKEMHKIAEEVDNVALLNRELKMFFPSVFVGMSPEDFRMGRHRVQLRRKNVAIMFVDIVKFSAICEANERSLQHILHVFLAKLESPVFRQKGLTKRLGDGFMAAFGFASDDDDLVDLCRRAHYTARLITRNLPKVNRTLCSQLPAFPRGGMRLRVGISAGKASIGVIQTDSMANADVYGSIVNLAQRLEDSGRYRGWDERGAGVLWGGSGAGAGAEGGARAGGPEGETAGSGDGTPRCIVSVSEVVHEALEESGELAKHGVVMAKREVYIKNEVTPRTAYVSVEEDIT